MNEKEAAARELIEGPLGDRAKRAVEDFLSVVREAPQGQQMPLLVFACTSMLRNVPYEWQNGILEVIRLTWDDVEHERQPKAEQPQVPPGWRYHGGEGSDDE